MKFGARNSFGAGSGVTFGPGFISPFIKWMLIANAGVFVLQNFFPWIDSTFGFTPSRFLRDPLDSFYQPFTYMFLHGSVSHILFNMLSLWMFGSEVERSLGTRMFARFYLLAGLSGAALTLAIKYSQNIPMIGASAAIYGVLIAYWLMFPQRQLYVFAIFPVLVKWAIPGMMVIGFFFGGPNVAHWAHLGGALFGLAFMKLDWQRGPASWYKSLRYKRSKAKLDQNRQKAEDVMRRVDAILDKINEVGIDNLSAEDRKFLEEASSELARKDHNR